MTIQLTVSGTQLIVTGSPEIVCDNADYTAAVTTTLTSPVLHLTAEQDGQNTEYTLPLTDGQTTLPPIAGAWGVWCWVTGTADSAETTTERVWIPCRESIKASAYAAYSAPYDVYNAAMEYANAVMTGSATQDELDAMLAALQYRYEHPPEWPGTAYKRAIAASVRETRLTGKITLTDSTEIPISSENIVESTFSIATSAVNDDYLLPGGVPSKELSASLRGDLPQETLRGAELEPTFRLRLESGAWQDIPLGTFTIMQAGDDTGRGIPVTAYDDMRRLDRIKPADCEFSAQTGYSPNQIISKICAAASIDYTQNIDYDSRFTGVSLHSFVLAALGVEDAWDWVIAIPNADGIDDIQAELDRLYPGTCTYIGDKQYRTDLPVLGVTVGDAYKVAYSGPTYVVSAISATVETARDLLMHACFAVGGFAELAANRKMTIKPIVPAHDVETITEHRTHRRAVSRLPYKLYSLSIPLEHTADLGVREITVYTGETIWPEDNVEAQANTNELWSVIVTEDNETQISAEQAQAEALTTHFDPVTYSPGRVDMYGDPTIGLMDWITTDGTRMMPVTGSVWRYRGQQQLTACGSDAIAKAAQTQLDKRLLGERIDQATETGNIMREIYGEFMQSYLGMQGFTYREIGHYTYRQLGGGVIT